MTKPHILAFNIIHTQIISLLILFFFFYFSVISHSYVLLRSLLLQIDYISIFFYLSVPRYKR